MRCSDLLLLQLVLWATLCLLLVDARSIKEEELRHHALSRKENGKGDHLKSKEKFDPDNKEERRKQLKKEHARSKRRAVRQKGRPIGSTLDSPIIGRTMGNEFDGVHMPPFAGVGDLSSQIRRIIAQYSERHAEEQGQSDLGDVVAALSDAIRRSQQRVEDQVMVLTEENSAQLAAVVAAVNQSADSLANLAETAEETHGFLQTIAHSLSNINSMIHQYLKGVPLIGTAMPPESTTTSLTDDTCTKYWEKIGSDCVYISSHDFSDLHNRLNWYDAREFCQNKGGDLLEPSNIYTLSNYLKENDLMYDFWLGGSDLNDETDWEWVSGHPIVSDAWSAQPRRDIYHNCLNFSTHENLPLSAGNCDDESYYICQKHTGLYTPTPTTVSEESLLNLTTEKPFWSFSMKWSTVNATEKPLSQGLCEKPYFKIGSECFKIVYKEMSWHDARSYCQAEGYDLAEPESVKMLRQHLQDEGQDYSDYWIGGTDEAEEGKWLWLSGRPVRDEWISGQPNGDDSDNCLDFQPDSDPSLNDYRCSEVQEFICEKPMEQSIEGGSLALEADSFIELLQGFLAHPEISLFKNETQLSKNETEPMEQSTESESLTLEANSFIKLMQGMLTHRDISLSKNETQLSKNETDTCYPADRVPCSEFPEGENFPHPRRCNKFLKCVGGRAVVNTCERGMLYNHQIGLCERSMNIRDCLCPSKIAPDECYPMDQVPCSEYPEGENFPHPTDCNKFLKCVGGSVVVKTCFREKLYNHLSGWCERSMDIGDCMCPSKVVPEPSDSSNEVNGLFQLLNLFKPAENSTEMPGDGFSNNMNDLLQVFTQMFHGAISEAVTGWCGPPLKLIGNECFFISDSLVDAPNAATEPEMTWRDAQEFCKENGGDLAEPKDLEALREIITFGYSYWIGSKYDESEHTWTWVSGENASHAISINLDANHQYCSLLFDMEGSIDFGADDCEKTQRWICEKPNPSVKTSKNETAPDELIISPDPTAENPSLSSDKAWTVIKDACIRNNNYKSIPEVVTIADCKYACIREGEICRSIDYEVTNQHCFLSEVGSYSDDYTEPCYDGTDTQFTERLHSDSCTLPFELVKSKCLYVGENEATWQEAEERCQNLNGNLAEVTEDQNAVIDFLSSKSGPWTWAWIARTQVSNSNQWLRSQNLVRGRWVEVPDYTYEGCLKLGVEYGGFKPYDCMAGGGHYICERKVSSSVSPNEEVYEPSYMLVGSELFLVRDEKLSWTMAQRACKKIGGYLAEPQNLTVLRNYMIQNNLEDDYWIGGSDQDNEGSWTWTESGQLIIENWMEDQPGGERSQNCLDFQPKELPSLNDYSCGVTQNYICQKDYQPPEEPESTAIRETDKTWTVIKDACIRFNNNKRIPEVVTITDCKYACIREGENCRSIEYEVTNQVCYLSYVGSDSDDYTEPCYDGTTTKFTERLHSEVGNYTHIGTERFMVVMQKKSWPDAREYCKQNGGDLASPKNLEALKDYLKEENEEHDYWLGGTDEAEEGTWAWLSGEMIVDSWKADQPSGGRAQNCLDFRSGHNPSLNDYECDETQFFICESESNLPSSVRHEGLHVSSIEVPKHLVVGQSTTLKCHVDLNGDTLYSLRWLKDDMEFYEFTPSGAPSAVLLTVEGISVNPAKSGLHEVELLDLQINSSGQYRCEVIGDAPTFNTHHLSANMTIIDCNEPYFQVENECFLVVKEEKTWYSAQNYCQDQGDILAVPTNQDKLADYLQEKQLTHDYWLGATDEAEEGTWISVTGEPIKWPNNFEVPINTQENCLDFRTDRTPSYHDYYCENDQYFICEHVLSNTTTERIASIPEKSCEDPYVMIGSECFSIVHYRSKTWHDAREDCKNDGGDLAVPSDLKLLQNYLNENNTLMNDYWLGGSDIEEEGKWLWLSGEEITSGWNDGVPRSDSTENCLDFRTDVVMPLHDYYCTSSQKYICEKPMTSTPDRNQIEIIPAVPKNVQAIGFNNGTISVTWDSPNKSSGPVEEYHIQLVQAQDDVLLYKSTINFITDFEDLVPGSTYNISVSAANAAGYGNSTEIVSVTIPTETCEEPFFALGDTCYQIMQGSYNWYQARQLCQEQDADLLQTSSLKFLHNSLRNNDYASRIFWMGASDEDEEGSWKWLSGEPVSSDIWDGRQPEYNININCMQLRYNKTNYHYLVDAYCNDVENVICEKPMNPSNDVKYTQIESEHFLAVFERAEWSRAREICQAKGGELAQPKDLDLLRNWIYNNKFTNTTSFWLGASDIEREGNWVWLNGSNVVHGWMKNEPDNRDHDENCLEFMTGNDQSLNDNRCSRTESFICELNVDEQDLFFTLGDEKFLVVEEWKPWEEALNSCNTFGGYLAEPKDLDLLKSHLREHNQIDADYWIGGSDSENEGTWKWLHGATINESLWINGEPDGDESENCLDFQPQENPSLNDYECKEAQYYICEKSEEKRNKISNEGCNLPFVQLGSECFLIVEDVLWSWQKARNYCQRNNADLAILNDINRLRKYLLRNDIEYNFWVGGSKMNPDTDKWLWVNGDPFTEEWRDDQPDDNNERKCLVFQSGYRPSYNANACHSEKSFICEKPTIGGKSVYDNKIKHPNHDLISNFEKTSTVEHNQEETTEVLRTTILPDEVTDYFGQMDLDEW